MKLFRFFPLIVLALSVFFFGNAQAYEGGGILSIVPSKESYQPGEAGTADIFLNTSGLLLENNEHIETIGISLLFSPEVVDVIGLGFSGSAFPTPYLSDFDNDSGTISFVRAKSDDPIPESAFVGNIAFRVRDDAPNGATSFVFRPGENSILLDDVYNSDILQNSVDGIFEIVGASVVPENSNTEENSDFSSFHDVAGTNARLFLTAGNTQIARGEETTIAVYIDTGDASNTVTSADFSVLFPKDILEVSSASADMSGSVFSGAGLNTVHADSGKIDLLLYSAGGIQTSSGKVASFVVRRIASGEANLFFSSNSALYANDVDNTDILGSTLGITLVEPTTSGGTSSGSNSSSGGSSHGGSRQSTTLYTQSSSGNDNLPVCEIVSDVTGEGLSSGKFFFSWTLPEDDAVESLELVWNSNSDSGSVVIPLVKTLTFPGKDMKPGTEYNFSVRSLGSECRTNETDTISVTKASSSSTSSSEPEILVPVPQQAATNPYAGNIASAKIPATPAGGPFEIISLFLISIAGFFFLSAVRRKG